MEKILEKIENYQFMNYLLPGIIFVSIYTRIVNISFFNINVIVGLVEYYFIGLVLSRIGSTIITSLLKKFNIIKNKNYEDYIESSKKDEKIDILQKEGNQYRTYAAMFLCLCFQQFYFLIFREEFYDIKLLITFACLFILFIMSYRKQSIFIAKRVEKANL